MSFIKYIKDKMPLSVKDNYWLFRDSIRGWRKFHNIYHSYPSNTTFLIGVPEHGNLGDQAIAMAEVGFLNDHFPEMNVVCIPEEEVYSHLFCIKKYTKKHPGTVIFLHGGGNIGELYIFPELIREHCIKMLKKSKIIVFPQSIDYSYDSHVEKRIRRIYELNNSLVLFIRENRSLKKANMFFPKTKVLLVPDIVLSYRFDSDDYARRGILLCLRNDKESKENTKRLSNQMVKMLDDGGYEYTWTDTHNDEMYSCEYTKQGEFVNNKLIQFAKSSVVVTDRLHGMIFALLTNTPCVALDNSTGKVSSFYSTWLRDSDIVFLNSEDDLEKARQLISSPEKYCSNLNQLNLEKKYEPLLDAIKFALYETG